MKATTWHSGTQFGIRVGTANRDVYFKREWTEIEVEIEGRMHRFRLTDGFWNACPEFRDTGTPVIGNWLRSKGLIPWKRSHPPCYELEPLGGSRFRLHLVGSGRGQK